MKKENFGEPRWHSTTRKNISNVDYCKTKLSQSHNICTVKHILLSQSTNRIKKGINPMNINVNRVSTWSVETWSPYIFCVGFYELTLPGWVTPTVFSASAPKTTSSINSKPTCGRSPWRGLRRRSGDVIIKQQKSTLGGGQMGDHVHDHSLTVCWSNHDYKTQKTNKKWPYAMYFS